MVWVGILGCYNKATNDEHIHNACGGMGRKCPGREDYCTKEMSVVLKVVRKEMGALF
jgi:hypothetical protein